MNEWIVEWMTRNDEWTNHLRCIDCMNKLRKWTSDMNEKTYTQIKMKSYINKRQTDMYWKKWKNESRMEWANKQMHEWIHEKMTN